MEVQEWLERDFEEEDVERAMEECGRDKAPKSDGLNFAFARAEWDFFFKNHFLHMLSMFHQRQSV